MAKKTTIKCPHCGFEYLPAEIYYPQNFLGNPENIIRDKNGAIIGFDGEDMDTKETYFCDKCGKNFSVDACVTFKVSEINTIFDEKDDF